jgi:hypothetical protein
VLACGSSGHIPQMSLASCQDPPQRSAGRPQDRDAVQRLMVQDRLKMEFVVRFRSGAGRRYFSS